MTQTKREVLNEDITQEDLDAIVDDPTGGNQEEKNEADEEKKEDEEKTDEENKDEDEKENEEKTEDKTDEDPEKKTPTSPELKDVEGETPREKGLRMEISRLRIANREEKTKNLVPKEDEKLDEKAIKELKDQGYDDEEINKLEKVVDILAAKKGYVKKSSLTVANDALDTFIEDHEEYAPENDKDDIRWDRFVQILKSDYNLKGKSPKQLRVIYGKVHRDINEELGEVKKDNTKKIEAQKEKIKSVSVSTSTSEKSKTAEEKEEPKKVGDKKHIIGGHNFVGFDDEDFN